MKHSDITKINDQIYQNPNLNDDNHGYDPLYKFLESSGPKDSDEGFFGAAFKKGNNIIIAFRGTNDISDPRNGESMFRRIYETAKDIEDNIGFKTGNPMSQYKEALAFAKHIQEKYGSDSEIYITGHSLGAGLSQLVGIKTNLKVVSIDAPGVFKVAKRIFSREQIEAHKDKITSYVSAPNIINTIGEHIVKPIQLKTKIDIDYNDNYLIYSTSQHSIENIAKSFDSSTGKPFSIIEYDKWPSFIESYQLFSSKNSQSSGSIKISSDATIFDINTIFSELGIKSNQPFGSMCTQGNPKLEQCVFKQSLAGFNEDALNRKWSSSNYGDKIETTSGYYDFLSDFNQGNYDSGYEFAKKVHIPFMNWNNNLKGEASEFLKASRIMNMELGKLHTSSYNNVNFKEW